MFLQLVINSLAIGSLYALTAMGATLIYGILGILDIANAGAYLIGAYIGYYIYISTGQLVLAFLGAMLAVGLLGVVLHRTVYGPILAKPRMLSRWWRRSACLPCATMRCACCAGQAPRPITSASL